jgi:hypothetical protein
MVVAGDSNPPAIFLNRLVPAAVTELHFVGLAAQGQSKNLVA